MSMKDKSVRIDDWANNTLVINAYDSKEVDDVLNANRCDLCDSGTVYSSENGEDLGDCTKCDGSGYSGDFKISWIDEANDEAGLNVYEYVNY